mmetsp:Transcript_6847/g.20836  ORF Transcript_6847/g.20836 Transcript_6847/m.20836 type:complete len:268 (+) Transcript_6847:1408-2211(+)
MLAIWRPRSFSPVPAAVRPKQWTADVPYVPRYSLPLASTAVPRAMLSAQSLPWRLAGPASATIQLPPVKGFFTSMASPTAHTCGTEVRIFPSTTIPPRAPSSTPAALAMSVSGRTPSPRMTTSAPMRLPSPAPPRTTSEPRPLVGASNALIGELSSTLTPSASIFCWSIEAISGSKGPRSWGSASTMVVSMPSLWSCSAISMPMKPPPATTAVLAMEAVPPPEIHEIMRSMSSRLRRARFPSRLMPGIGGRNGLAPSESTSSSYFSE